MAREAVMETDKKQASPIVKTILVIICILLSPIILIVGLLYYFWSLIISLAAWLFWNLRGRDILFVHSNSPIWSNYLEEQIFPVISDRAIILNWSERRQWKFSLAFLIFKQFAGTRDFNPIAIVFRPFRLNKIFRFYRAFKDFKHGKIESLELKKMEFFKSLGI